MNCSEVRNLTALYLSREMDAGQRQSFSAHLAVCASCESDVAQYEALDCRIRGAFSAESPGVERIQKAVRREISAAESRRWWMISGAAAASVLVLGGVLWGLMRLESTPQWYSEAARDHRVEVIQGEARRWRTTPAEIEAVSAQSGLSFAQAAALAPEGYALERAKICGIDGQRMLHLIFANGSRKHSVYLQPHEGVPERFRAVSQGAERVAGIDTGRFRVIVVANAPAVECEAYARWAAEHL